LTDPSPPRIYTKTGDAGDTGLFDGTRVAKSDPRVEACGEVDEVSAALGVARQHLTHAPELAALIEGIQGDLLAVGARLADPSHRISERVTKINLGEAHISKLETWIDSLDASLPPLRRFILPGGSPAGAALHLARAVARRAERRVVSLGETVDPVVIVYLNRLSDLLFVAARAANVRAGLAETEW
jgi:cob(I)alamin adenosyltransferase